MSWISNCIPCTRSETHKSQLLSYHFSFVIDFSSKKYIVSASLLIELSDENSVTDEKWYNIKMSQYIIWINLAPCRLNVWAV